MFELNSYLEILRTRWKVLGKQQRPSVGCCLTGKEGLNRWRGKHPVLQAGDLGEREQKKKNKQTSRFYFLYSLLPWPLWVSTPSSIESNRVKLSTDVWWMKNWMNERVMSRIRLDLHLSQSVSYWLEALSAALGPLTSLSGGPGGVPSEEGQAQRKGAPWRVVGSEPFKPQPFK